MRYYITDRTGAVVGKFDGVEVDLRDGHTKHAVESIQELSSVTVDSWHEEYRS